MAQNIEFELELIWKKLVSLYSLITHLTQIEREGKNKIKEGKWIKAGAGARAGQKQEQK